MSNAIWPGNFIWVCFISLERNPCEGCGRDFKSKTPSTMGILLQRTVLLNLRKDGPTHLKHTHFT
jgi:hypothetical protein